jgi:hypothetical protein
MAIADSLKKLQMKFVFRKEAEIGGVKFTLQVLSLKEEQRVQSVPSEGLDGVAYFNEMQKSILSNAIRAIDGEEIPDIVESDVTDGPKTTKERQVYLREVLETMPGPIVDNLFQVYADMRDQKENEISSSLTYSWYKTPEVRENERKQKEDEDRRTKDAAAKEALLKVMPKEPTADGGGVPSPNAEVNLRKLATDFEDDKETKSKA